MFNTILTHVNFIHSHNIFGVIISHRIVYSRFSLYCLFGCQKIRDLDVYFLFLFLTDKINPELFTATP